eukprot:TRINITY_DN4912_c0_g1_i2.p1 TRINITY_DN4912_c0_g1~~TRINITY_DN4912_c0_g1_i2.p1  ORF type:complete len:229 (-),score=47.54 TRINITY_DN4912_c0_g1_i2:34-720(-)
MQLGLSSDEDVRKNILIAGVGTSFFSIFSAFLAILTHSWMFFEKELGEDWKYSVYFGLFKYEETEKNKQDHHSEVHPIEDFGDDNLLVASKTALFLGTVSMCLLLISAAFGISAWKQKNVSRRHGISSNLAIAGGVFGFLSTMAYAYLRPKYGDFEDATYGWAYFTMLMSAMVSIIASSFASYVARFIHQRDVDTLMIRRSRDGRRRMEEVPMYTSVIHTGRDTKLDD